MLIKNITVFMAMQCLVGFSSAYATEYNYKLLEMRADTFNQRVWATSEFTTSPKEIEESLDFLNGPNKSSGSGKDFPVLREQCEQTISRLKMSDLGNHAANNFKTLIAACQDVYDTKETTKQAGISMLFETILSKSSANIKRIERSLKKGDTSSRSNGTSMKNLDYFLHADKSQPLVNQGLDVF
jgi:hypothetical protein